MRKVFISFVGLGNEQKTPGYDEVAYAWQGKTRKTCFVQTAILCAEGIQSWDAIILLFTEQSAKKHRDLLLDELRRCGSRESQVVVREYFPADEMNPEEQWSWFESLLDLVDSGDRVTFDFTHGYRSIPILFSSAISFLQVAKGIEVAHVLYGVYDRRRQEPYPIVDMRQFYVINQWAEAVVRLTEDADARKLAEVSSRFALPYMKVLSDGRLQEALVAMTDCIRNVDVHHVSASVSRTLAIVEELCRSSSGMEKLLLDLVVRKFTFLAFEDSAPDAYSAGYFEIQLKIIEVLLEHRLYMQAFTAMRECIGSIGMVGLKRAGIKCKGKNRDAAEVFIKMIQFPKEKWDFSKVDERYEKHVDGMAEWYGKLDSLGVIEILKEIGEQKDAAKDKKAGNQASSAESPNLFDLRNGFDHAWTTKNSPGNRRIEEAGKEFFTKLKEAMENMKKGNLL